MELTDRYVAELAFADGAPYAARDALPGFFVSVGKRRKTFTVQCDLRDDLGRRRTKKVTIGNFPELSVKQARAKAKATIGALQTAGKFEERRKSWTLGEAWEHMRDFELPRKGSRPRTVEGYDKVLRTHMADWLAVPLRKFADKPHLVEERHFKISHESGPYAANGYCCRHAPVVAHVLRLGISAGFPGHGSIPCCLLGIGSSSQALLVAFCDQLEGSRQSQRFGKFQQSESFGAVLWNPVAVQEHEGEVVSCEQLALAQGELEQPLHQSPRNLVRKAREHGRLLGFPVSHRER